MSFYTMKYLHKIIILAVLLAVLFGVGSASYAIDMPRIDRSKIRLYIKPGGAESGEITIENTTDEMMFVKVYLQDWYYASGDGSKNFVPPSTTVHSCASWISFSPADLAIPPFSRKGVKYNVKVPEGANGGYYAVLFFENQIGGPLSGDLKEAVGVNVAVRFATLFYIEADGTAQREARVGNIFLKKAGLYAPLLINGDFRNNGNVDIISSGVFAIMDQNGRVQGRGQINDIYTLPGDNTKLKGIWRESLAPGDYAFILTLDLGKGGHKSELQRGPFLIKEIEIKIASDGSLSDYKVSKE